MSQERTDLILIMLTLKFEGSEPSSFNHQTVT